MKASVSPISSSCGSVREGLTCEGELGHKLPLHYAHRSLEGLKVYKELLAEAGYFYMGPRSQLVAWSDEDSELLTCMI